MLAVDTRVRPGLDPFDAGTPYELDLPPGLCLKARPATEGDERFIYCEPSNESRDAQNERLFQKALEESAPHFLKFGNVDLEHKSMPAVAKLLGIDEPELWDIGYPVEVRPNPIMVKAVIYRGEGRRVLKANLFWEAMTQVIPPPRYYPSVGGRAEKKVASPDGVGSDIISVLWTNLAFAREPVNRTVKAVSLMPFDTFCKGVVAGYGTDTQGLEGGGALRRESLHPTPVATIPGGAQPPRDDEDATFARAAAQFLRGQCRHADGGPYTVATLAAHFRECAGMTPERATRAAARLLHLVQRARAGRPDITPQQQAAAAA